jgi:shikimate dehydrogenase
MGVWLQFAELAPGARALGADLVVSTVPRGAADALADYEWRPDQAVFDVVYDPWPTPLAHAAATRGAKVLSGALLLLHQAAAQVELMTGQEAPVHAMRAALHAAAPGCGV